MLGCDRLVNLRELALRALDGYAGLESRDHSKVAAGAARVGIGHGIAEHPPDLRPGRRNVIEVFRHYANDGHGRPADRDRLADDGRIATEPALPEGVSDDDNALSARHVFILSLIHISEPTRLLSISYAVF